MSDLEISILLYKALLADNNDAAQLLKNKIESKYKSLMFRIDWLGNKHPLDLDSYLIRFPNINTDTFKQILTRLKSHVDDTLPSQLPHNSFLLSGQHSITRTVESINHDFMQYKINSLLCKRLHGPAYPHASVNVYNLLHARRLRGSVGIKLSVPVEFHARTILYRRIFGHLAPVYCVTFDQTGQFIFTGADDNLIKIWSARDGRLLSTLRGHLGEITDLSINYENRLLASGSMDKFIRIWDLKTGKMIECLNTHTAMITSVKFSPYNRHGTDRYLISTSNDGTVVFWMYHVDKFGFKKLKKLQERKTPGAQMVCSSFSVGGSFLACGSSDKSVYVYAFTPHSDPYKLIELEPHEDQVDSIQFCNHGFRFVSGSKDGTAIIWMYKRGKWEQINLRMSENNTEGSIVAVSMVNWSKDDKYVITSASDHSIKIWESLTGQLMHTLHHHESEVYLIECNPIDPRIFLTGGHDGKIVLWDIERGLPLKIFQNTIDNQNKASLYDCKFSPDGTMFAVTDSYGHLSLFGLGSDCPYQAIPDHMFFNYDYRGLVRDIRNFVMDEQTHLPPHMMWRYMQLVDMNGNPHPRGFQYLVPDFTNTDLVTPLTEHQRKFIHDNIEEHSYTEDEEFLIEKNSQSAGTSEMNQKFINNYNNQPQSSAPRHLRRPPRLVARIPPPPPPPQSSSRRLPSPPDSPAIRPSSSRLRTLRVMARGVDRITRGVERTNGRPLRRVVQQQRQRLRYFDSTEEETDEEIIVRPQRSRQQPVLQDDGETTEIESDSTEINYQLEEPPRPTTPQPTRTSARIQQKYGRRKRRRYH